MNHLTAHSSGNTREIQIRYRPDSTWCWDPDKDHGVRWHCQNKCWTWRRMRRLPEEEWRWAQLRFTRQHWYSSGPGRVEVLHGLQDYYGLSFFIRNIEENYTNLLNITILCLSSRWRHLGLVVSFLSGLYSRQYDHICCDLLLMMTLLASLLQFLPWSPWGGRSVVWRSRWCCWRAVYSYWFGWLVRICQHIHWWGGGHLWRTKPGRGV